MPDNTQTGVRVLANTAGLDVLAWAIYPNATNWFVDDDNGLFVENGATTVATFPRHSWSRVEQVGEAA